MKMPAFLHKPWLRWLNLCVFLFVNLFPAQTARAEGPCATSDIHHGVISADETWCAGGSDTHYLSDNVTVQPGVTLTIAAGVTVDSLEGAWSKYLIIQGHLDIKGTLAQPVYLTRSVNYPNQNWGGLYFDGSQGDGSGSINYAIIDHAGANFLPPGCVGSCGIGQTAVFVKDVGNGKQVVINHSTIHDNVSKGLYVVDGNVNVSNTTFGQNKYPVWIEGQNSVIAYSGNSFTGNAYPYYDNTNYSVSEDSIILGANALTGQNFTLPAQTGLDAYVFFSGTTIPAGITMTVEPGVVLRSASDGYLSVLGNLNAVGTAALPILFSGIPSSVQGVNLYWGGLYFDGTEGDGGGRISHAIIERAGGNSLPPGCTGACGTAQTAVFIKGLPVDQLLDIGYSTIQNSLGKGLYVVNSQTAHVDNNLIKGGRIGVDFASNMIVSNLALIDQAYDGVIVENGYRMDGRHLTIASAGQSGLHVSSGGTALLQNSILSHNALAVWAEGSGNSSLNTNLSDANTVFKVGAVTTTNTITGAAAFEADGYHIQTTSAAVGVGLSGLASMDVDGNARPWPTGSQPDLGVDEVSVGVFRLFLPLLNRFVHAPKFTYLH